MMTRDLLLRDGEQRRSVQRRRSGEYCAAGLPFCYESHKARANGLFGFLAMDSEHMRERKWRCLDLLRFLGLYLLIGKAEPVAQLFTVA